MKKVLFALTIGFTSIAALSNCAYAQNSTIPVAFNDKSFMPSVRYIAALESIDNMGTFIPDAKSINAKAVKDFQTRFADANDAKWFADRNGFVSYFVKDGYGDRAFYDKKGHWRYSLIFYTETKLPRNVRSAVRSIYFDMNITLIEEVQTPDGKVYIVHLEDQSNIKILKVNDDCDMEIMQDLTKA